MQHPSQILATMSEVLKAGRAAREAFNGAERLVTNAGTLAKLIGVSTPVGGDERLYMGLTITSSPLVPPGIIMGFRRQGPAETMVWCNAFDVPAIEKAA